MHNTQSTAFTIQDVCMPSVGCEALIHTKMLDLHFLVCVKVCSETQVDPWETMQPFNGPWRGVCLHKSWR